MEDSRILPINLSKGQKLQTLVIGRLLVVFLLLVLSWVWQSGHLKLSYEDFPRGLFLVFLISVGLTIVYFFVMRLNSNYAWQVRLQFFLDAMLITWLVWRTGGVTSPYLTLYFVLISVSSVFLSGRETVLVSVLCVGLFSTLAFATSYSFIESVGELPDQSKVVQIIGFNNVALFVVGLLSARLAERYSSSEELKETTKTLANLRVLHERIIESIKSGLITIDLDGTIYTFNKTAEEITGRRAEEVQGSSVFELLGDIRGQVSEALAANEDSRIRHEIGFRTPDGFVVQLGYGLSPLFTKDGEKTGLIITFQDLTDIRSMEESIRRKDRLSAVGRVAAGLAHEIRNPLGAMRGAIQILESKTEKDTAQANLMEIILRESDRLNEIITDFLKYARPRNGNFSDVDVKEALTDTITLLRHSPDISDEISLIPELPVNDVFISADVSQLKQIFWNLARNSIQALDGNGEIKISLKELQTNRIRILFEDNGCGMPAEQVEQLFEPFSTSTTGGTGLGLSIVYQIVRDHNGTITITSKENSGTRITIELPTDYTKPAVAGEESDGEADDPTLVLKNYLHVAETQKEISS